MDMVAYRLIGWGGNATPGAADGTDTVMGDR